MKLLFCIFSLSVFFTSTAAGEGAFGGAAGPLVINDVDASNSMTTINQEANAIEEFAGSGGGVVAGSDQVSNPVGRRTTQGILTGQTPRPQQGVCLIGSGTHDSYDSSNLGCRVNPQVGGVSQATSSTEPQGANPAPTWQLVPSDSAFVITTEDGSEIGLRVSPDPNDGSDRNPSTVVSGGGAGGGPDQTSNLGGHESPTPPNPRSPPPARQQITLVQDQSGNTFYNSARGDSSAPYLQLLNERMLDKCYEIISEGIRLKLLKKQTGVPMYDGRSATVYRVTQVSTCTRHQDAEPQPQLPGTPLPDRPRSGNTPSNPTLTADHNKIQRILTTLDGELDEIERLKKRRAELISQANDQETQEDAQAKLSEADETLNDIQERRAAFDSQQQLLVGLSLSEAQDRKLKSYNKRKNDAVNDIEKQTTAHKKVEKAYQCLPATAASVEECASDTNGCVSGSLETGAKALAIGQAVAPGVAQTLGAHYNQENPAKGGITAACVASLGITATKLALNRQALSKLEGVISKCNSCQKCRKLKAGELTELKGKVSTIKEQLDVSVADGAGAANCARLLTVGDPKKQQGNNLNHCYDITSQASHCVKCRNNPQGSVDQMSCRTLLGEDNYARLTKTKDVVAGLEEDPIAGDLDSDGYDEGTLSTHYADPSGQGSGGGESQGGSGGGGLLGASLGDSGSGSKGNKYRGKGSSDRRSLLQGFNRGPRNSFLRGSYYGGKSGKSRKSAAYKRRQNAKRVLAQNKQAYLKNKNRSLNYYRQKGVAPPGANIIDIIHRKMHSVCHQQNVLYDCGK